MAEDTPTTAPAAEERAPDAETKPADSAPETSQEKETEKAAEPEKEKPSEKDTSAQEEKKESAEAPAEQPSASAEATDAKEPQEGAAAAQPETATPANGTPASAKKGGSSKRKSGGIPEHKSNANRRKSQNRVLQLNAKPGEYYLARLRSFPPWPSIICDDELLPQSLLDARPVSAMQADGSVRPDYAEGGKRAHERTFPVMFFQTNEFAWIQNTCLTPLDPESCKNVSEKSKSKVLLQAYAVAAEGHDLDHFKTLLADHQRALDQEIEEQEAKAAAKAEKDSKKNKRKSMDIVDDDAEDIEMGDADDAKKSKSSKKRKKDAKDDEEKPAKTPKTGTKLKLTTPKTPASEGGKKTAAASKSKQTASSKKAKAASDEEEETAEAKQPEKQISPEEAKKKKEKEVLFIRHKLQKGFLSRDQQPKEEEMTSMANCLTKLENYDEIEISVIRHTKINKVLKMIVKLNFVPRDEELQFRQRAMNILSKWKSLEPETATPTDDKEAKANGVHKEDGAETPSKAQPEGEKQGEQGQKEDTNEPLDDPMPDADAEDKTKAPELVKEVEADVSKEGEVSEPKVEDKKTEAAPEPAAETEKTSEDKEKPAEQQQPAEQKEEGEKAEEKKTEEKTAEEATA